MVARGRFGALQRPQHQIGKEIQLADGTNAHPEPRRQTAAHPFQNGSSITSRTAVTSTASRLRFSVESDQSVTIGIPRRAHQVRTSSAFVAPRR